ncbi:MAG: hypothetical protein P9X26_02380 [Candidatus Stygibacter frigidus]|nr:hypothetical protein [Candidatus Stygibacter frigidus]
MSNIIVEQRDDGSYQVDIYYDLEYVDCDTRFVNVMVYADNDQLNRRFTIC